MTDPPLAACLLQDAINLLSRAVDWWETIQAMDAASGGRGVSFAPEYEPAWLADARRAVSTTNS